MKVSVYVKCLVYDERNAHEYNGYSAVSHRASKNHLYKTAILNCIYQFFYDFYHRKLDYEDIPDRSVRYQVLKSNLINYTGREGHQKHYFSKIKLSSKKKKAVYYDINKEAKKKSSERIEGSYESKKDRARMYATPVKVSNKKSSAKRKMKTKHVYHR